MRGKLAVPMAAVALCALGVRAPSTEGAGGPEPGAVTFNKDVAPILFENCVQCHRPGETAPMSLLSYEEARPWARSIRDRVAAREMPPWPADPSHGQFANDRRLSQKDVDTVVAWVNQGARPGDAKDLPPRPTFVEGWSIGKPDVVITMPEEFAVPADGVVAYQRFVAPTHFKEDRWVVAAELRPGVRSVVHHILAYTREADGSRQTVLTGYAPGEQPLVLPAGLGSRVSAGANIVFEVHYTPNGAAARDRSYLGLVFAKERPAQELQVRPVWNRGFVIPPGDPSYGVTSSYTFTEDARIVSLMPHMHYRGKDFEYRLSYPDGTSRVLLSVPRYDFNWQLSYLLKEPVAVPKGARLECVAHYDNSTRNRYNPDPGKEVRWGDQTWEEMMIGWMTYTLDSQRRAAATP